jgi:MYXO-CTERM domain-containing protein
MGKTAVARKNTCRPLSKERLMSHRLVSISGFLLAALCASSLLCARAHADEGAGLEACSNIYVEAEAECVLVPPEADCEGMCEPISVEAACAVELSADCRAECNELPSVACTATCRADCAADCEVDPGKFDCKTACGADCSGHCDAQCRGSSNRADCEVSCEGSCAASCDSRCDVEAPSASCEARCEASCDGSCEVDTNFDCQAECQADARAACVARVEGGCELQCTSQDGALFCDGQYVDYGDNLDKCVQALQAQLDARIDASGESMCEGNTCTAKGRVSSDCAVTRPGAARSPSIWLATGALGLLGLARLRRRKR